MMVKSDVNLILHLINKAGFYRQIREPVYLSCDGMVRWKPNHSDRYHYPGKASQGDCHQIVPITDTGGLVE